MRSLRSSLASLTVALTLVTAAMAAPSSPGYVDFGKFPPASGKQFVEIDVDASLLKLAATFAGQKDPEVAALLGHLERVRVNVIGLTDDTRLSVTERVEAVRQQLTQDGWKRVVTVREEKGDNVGVFLKQGSDDAILGVVVTVLSSNNEAVLVNVVGDVKLEQIAALGDRLDIEPLRQLNLAAK